MLKEQTMSKKIGLALGGGAVLGAAHVGVLRALEEFDYEITHVSGTSIGSLVASLVAFGKSWEEIQDIALNLNWLQAARLKISKLGLLSIEKLGDSIIEMIGDVTFEEARIPLCMVATDISNGERIVLSSGSVPHSIMASCCIPGVFAPLELNGRKLVDGGIVENVPILALKEQGVSPIIGIDLISHHAHREPTSMIEVLINSFAFTVSRAVRMAIDAKDVRLISPELSEFNSIDTRQIPELIERGYRDAMEILNTMR